MKKKNWDFRNMSEQELKDNCSNTEEKEYYRELEEDEIIVINENYKQVQLCLSNRAEAVKSLRELMDLGVEHTEKLTESMSSILQRIKVEGESKKLLKGYVDEMEFYFNNGQMKFTGVLYIFEDFVNEKVIKVDAKGIVIETEDMGEGYQRNLFKQAN